MHRSSLHQHTLACTVPLQQRPDAEAARKALDGLVLHGMEMRVGWGKAVPLPPVPLYSGTGVPTGPLTGERGTTCVPQFSPPVTSVCKAWWMQCRNQS
jgi:U2-associated protein SR140